MKYTIAVITKVPDPREGDAGNLAHLPDIYYEVEEGGWIEAVRLADDLLLYCNEEGKLERLPMNYMATNLVARILPGWGDWLVGSVVLVGDDGSPNSAGIPDRWIQALTELGLWPIRG